MSFQDAATTVNDVKLKLRRAGAGETALFLHGAGGVYQWLPAFERLAAKYDLLVPDHPGFGKSDDPKGIRDIHDMAMFYLDFLDELGLDNVHLIGHSLGAWIAAEAAVRNCSQIKSLTLIAPAGLRIKDLVIGDNFIWTPEEHVRKLYCDQSLAEQVLRQALTVNDDDIAIQAKNNRTVAKLGWDPRWFDPHLAGWLHRAKVPAHVIWGDSDLLFPCVLADEWKRCLPNASVTILKKCGHLPMVEQPDLVTEKIHAFICEV